MSRSRKAINDKMRTIPEKYTASREHIRRSTENEIKLANPTEFFNKINRPIESKLVNFINSVKEKSEEQLDTTGVCRIVEINPENGKWRWRMISNTQELRETIITSEKAHANYMKVREAKLMSHLKKSKESGFDGYSNYGTYSGPNNTVGFEVRPEYTPLIGTPFYKQLYLYDYWEMHSKCFWYRNYSGIGKFIVDTTRNFVMGRGFNVSFKDDKAQTAWERYAERTNIYEESRHWCDDLTSAGEVMIKKIPGPLGISHKAFDASTVWDICTDPENLSDIKFFHQQYNTQYQLYTTKDAPSSKYIINQIPPELVIHGKVNVTQYEKRGRADLLAPLLYLKYYEDYSQSRLIRAKNESAFIWDVTITGSDEDVSFYINNSQSIGDVPPGSENVHNDMVKRTPLSPTFGARGQDDTASDILSYIGMSVTIPGTYFGTMKTAGGTKAGALVGTEPVAKKMVERQLKMELLLRIVVKDVLADAGLDPATPFEINWPEIMEEDSTQKIQNLVLAKQQNAIAHRTMSEMITKELRMTKYDYDAEIKLIKQEMRDPALFDAPDLTPDANGGDNTSDRSMDRPGTKDENTSY